MEEAYEIITKGFSLKEKFKQIADFAVALEKEIEHRFNTS